MSALIIQDPPKAKKMSLRKLWPSKKLYKILIIAGAAVLVLAPAGYFGYKYYKYYKSKAQNKTTTQQEESKDKYTVPMPDMPKNRTLDELKQAEKTATTKEEKLGIYGNMTALYAQQKDYKSALETTEKVRALDPENAGKTNYQTALLYEMSGNKAKAIEYYRKELDRVKAMSDEDYLKESIYDRASRIFEMEENIKRLGGVL